MAAASGVGSPPATKASVHVEEQEEVAALDIAQQRLRHQYTTEAPFDWPEEVVERLVAVQAQDYYGAHLNEINGG